MARRTRRRATATWLPPNKAYRCTYVVRQVDVKALYHLWVTPAEHDAIANLLTGRAQTTPNAGLTPLSRCRTLIRAQPRVAVSTKANSALLPAPQRSRQLVSRWCATRRKAAGTGGVNGQSEFRVDGHEFSG
jgi:hypothetical protein